MHKVAPLVIGSAQSLSDFNVVQGLKNPLSSSNHLPYFSILFVKILLAPTLPFTSCLFLSSLLIRLSLLHATKTRPTRSVAIAMLQNPVDKYNESLRCSTSFMLKEMPIKATKILFFIFEGGEYKKVCLSSILAGWPETGIPINYQWKLDWNSLCRGQFGRIRQTNKSIY